MTSSETSVRYSSKMLEQLERALESLSVTDERSKGALAQTKAHIHVIRGMGGCDSEAKHITASAVIVGPRGVILHRHLEDGLWLLPGGHVEAGEAPWDTALREAHEETGMKVYVTGNTRYAELIHVDVHESTRGHTHFDLRYLLFSNDSPRPPQHESQDIDWFNWNHAVQLADPTAVGAVRAGRRAYKLIQVGTTDLSP